MSNTIPISPQPFSISPNPTALYLTANLMSAIHKARYTINQRQGLACIFGDPGLGKSSVLRYLASGYESEEGVTTGFLTEPETSSPYAFVRGICQAFDLPGRRSLVDQKNTLRDFIYAEAEAGRNVVLMLDEAQGLDSAMLEIVRHFLNYESNNAKLIQIVLAGQLDLRKRLKLPSNRPIRSRVIMYSLLEPLTELEARKMIDHRCEMAQIENPFPADVMKLIYDFAGGVPRDILRTCASVYELSSLSRQPISAGLAASIIESELATMGDEVADEEGVAV